MAGSILNPVLHATLSHRAIRLPFSTPSNLLTTIDESAVTMSDLNPQRRDQDILFNQRTWYRFEFTSRQSTTMSAGFERSNPAISMTPLGLLGSENWQLFPQGGRHFIRNWAWGSNFQLGLDKEGNRSALFMLPRSGSLSQQWTIKKVDGGFELTNGLFGNGTKLNLPEWGQAPQMRNQVAAGLWNITRNESADSLGPKNVELYDEVVGFEVSQPSSASTTSSGVPSASNTTPSPSLSPTNSQSQSTLLHTTSSTLPSPPSTSSVLSNGAIAGVVIGAIVGLVLFLGSIVIVMRQKRRNVPQQVHEKPAGAMAPRTATQVYRGELAVPPLELPIHDMRTELGPGSRT